MNVIAALFSRLSVFRPLYGLVDEDYVPLSWNASLPYPYVFAALSAIEANYGRLTNNRYRLSAGQVQHHLLDYLKEREPGYPGDQCRAVLKGTMSPEDGDAICVIDYIKENGIMLEYDFPLSSRSDCYDEEKLTPIRITGVDMIGLRGDRVEGFMTDGLAYTVERNNATQWVYHLSGWLLSALGWGSAIIELDPSLLEGDQIVVPQGNQDFNPDTSPTVAVVVTAAGLLDGDERLVIEVVNAWGENDSRYGKYYIDINELCAKAQFRRMISVGVAHDPEAIDRIRENRALRLQMREVKAIVSMVVIGTTCAVGHFVLSFIMKRRWPDSS